MITLTHATLFQALPPTARAIAITLRSLPRRILPPRLIYAGLLAAMSGVALAQSTTAPAPASVSIANGPPASAALCFSCHGPDGNPITPDYPILKGQQRGYLVAALAAYRGGERAGAPNAQAMTAIAKGLTDAEIAEMADWFAMVRR